MCQRSCGHGSRRKSALVERPFIGGTLQRFPGVQHNLRPRFEFVSLFPEFFGREKTELADRFLPGADGVVAQLDHMHNAKMDLPDFGRVVVNQSGEAILPRSLEPELLRYFPVNRRAIGILVERKETLIAIVNVASDADRSPCPPSRFSPDLAPRT